jgi:hypothetical protein
VKPNINSGWVSSIIGFEWMKFHPLDMRCNPLCGFDHHVDLRTIPTSDNELMKPSSMLLHTTTTQLVMINE